FSIAPVAAILCFLIGFLTWLWICYWVNLKNIKLFWPSIISLVLVLAISRVNPLANLGLVATLGVTFCLLKAIGVILDYSYFKKQTDLIDVLFLVFFFPTFSSGPIEKIETFAEVKKLTVNDIFFGSLRISLGFFKAGY